MPEKEMRLSDLVERQYAEEVALKAMPASFKWEVSRKTELTTVPDWLVDAMIEFAKMD